MLQLIVYFIRQLCYTDQRGFYCSVAEHSCPLKPKATLGLSRSKNKQNNQLKASETENVWRWEGLQNEVIKVRWIKVNHILHRCLTQHNCKNITCRIFFFFHFHPHQKSNSFNYSGTEVWVLEISCGKVCLLTYNGHFSCALPRWIK